MLKAAEAAVKEEMANGVSISSEKPSRKRKGPRDTRNDPIKCLTYHDPFSATYKKYIFTADGSHLLGGIMIGDTSSFTKLVAIVKKKVSVSHCVFNVPATDMSFASRRSWTCPLLNLLLALRKQAKTMVVI